MIHPLGQTVVDALDKPSTLTSLLRKTGYPIGRVLEGLIRARAAGHRIRATYRPNLPTYYERIDK